MGALDQVAAVASLLDSTDKRRSPAPDDEAQATTLARELGHLALALEMAAATIAARRFSFATYRDLWQRDGAHVLGWADLARTGHHHAVAQTWLISVAQLTPAGRTLLERLAFLAPDPIPETLMDVAVPGVADVIETRAALDDLTRYALAKRNGAGAFMVHPLVQEMTRLGLARSELRPARLAEALGWVDAAFRDHPMDVRTWPVLTPLAPHAETVAGLAADAAIADPTVYLMGQLAALLHAQALHARAETVYRSALAPADSSFQWADARIVARLYTLARYLKQANRLEEARPLLLRAASIGQVVSSGNLFAIAFMLRRSRPAEAEALLRWLLAMLEARLGASREYLAYRLLILASLVERSNRLDKAEALMRRVLEIDEARFGANHPYTANARTILANLLQSAGRLDEAEPLLRRLTSIDAATRRADNPSVAINLDRLARLLQATNRLNEAEPLIRRAMAFVLAFGEELSFRDSMIENYKRILSGMGKTEAEIDAALGAVAAEAAVTAAAWGGGKPNGVKTHGWVFDTILHFTRGLLGLGVPAG